MKLLKMLMVPFSRWNARKYKRTNGRKCGKLFDIDLCVITVKGRKSKELYDIPIIHIPYKNGVILVASQGGAPHNPQWYYNLINNPKLYIQIKGEIKLYTAKLATDSERGWLWPLCVLTYPGYAAYQARTNRQIPLFICEPMEYL